MHGCAYILQHNDITKEKYQLIDSAFLLCACWLDIQSVTEPDVHLIKDNKIDSYESMPHWMFFLGEQNKIN